MRCLYCGKELALLKRLTSGGEFCSDAHRQQYQDEYNQLALNRLLQAKPPVEEKPAPEAKPAPAEKKHAEKTTEKKVAPEPARTIAPTPVPAMIVAPPPPPPAPAAIAAAPVQAAVQIEEEPVGDEVIDEPAPAEPAGFFLELPVPAVTEVASISAPDLEMEYANSPTVPQCVLEPWGTELISAGQVVMQHTITILDSAGPPLDRRVDVREFVRGATVVSVDVPLAGETTLPEAIHEPMEIPIVRYPPQEVASLWQAPAQEFTSFETELGELARLAFGTTGFENTGDEESSPREESSIETRSEGVAPQPIPAPPVIPAAKNAPPEATSSTVFTPIFPEPVRSATPPATEAKREPVPELITTPMPMTLHAVAAGRGKPVQVFTSGVQASVDVQIPRSTSLPLRPVMTLEAAPAASVVEEKKIEEKKAEEKKVEEKKIEEKKPSERTFVVKQDSRRSQPGRQDPRFANGKVRKQDRATPAEPQPEPKAPEIAAVAPAVEEKIETRNVKAPEPKVVEIKAPEVTAEKPSEKTPEKVQDKTPEKIPAPKIEVSRETPEPAVRPYNPSDLGLPSLSLQSSGGFLSTLPVGAKLGLAALIAIVIGSVIYFSTKGGSADAASNAPRVVEAPALPSGDSGWITDWGTEPGVRRQHDISILSASRSLTDYRMEFQAQIENKALGWVYRARDGKDYYVSKLEIVKPGINPTVALIRFAVINGEEQPRAQFPLNMQAHLDTVYNIRFDAVGDHFTTFVQDQKIDDFTDDRIKTGGIGMYSEHGERLGLKGSVRVVPLVIKK